MRRKKVEKKKEGKRKRKRRQNRKQRKSDKKKLALPGFKPGPGITNVELGLV